MTEFSTHNGFKLRDNGPIKFPIGCDIFSEEDCTLRILQDAIKLEGLLQIMISY